MCRPDPLLAFPLDVSLDIIHAAPTASSQDDGGSACARVNAHHGNRHTNSVVGTDVNVGSPAGGALWLV